MNKTGVEARTPEGSEVASVSLSAMAQEGPHVVCLLPSEPPGRCTRKALPFAHEIRRLHAAGYTLEAIRRALSKAGVSVSRSTVHREVTRRASLASPPVASKPDQKNATAMPARSPSESSTAAEVNEAPTLTTGDRRSGKDIAEAFFRNLPTNPLLRAKDPP